MTVINKETHKLRFLPLAQNCLRANIACSVLPTKQNVTPRWPLTCAILLLLLLSLGLAGKSYAQAKQSEFDESYVKAVYLERFTRFIEWPLESDYVPTIPPFSICVIDNPKFAKHLITAYEQRMIKKSPVSVKEIKRPTEVSQCHLLFISTKIPKRAKEILAQTKDKPILTVSDTAGFAELGTLINFYISKNKLRFEINQTEVENSQLNMSYKLLSLARIINKR